MAQEDEATAFGVPAVVENRGGQSPFVVLCDHATNAIPPEYGSLGLAPAALDTHIAWDPGALGVAERLAERLDAVLVHAAVSRLIIDCNRTLDAPDLIAERSEATAIPGNAGLADAERRRRIAMVHAPYHATIDRLIDQRLDQGRATALVAVHSFNPTYHNVPRPWEIGVLFDRNRRLADSLIAAFQGEGATVGVNEPYSPADRVYYTLTRHAEERGLDCVMLELRNDLIAGDAAQRAWAERIAAALAATRAEASPAERLGAQRA